MSDIPEDIDRVATDLVRKPYADREEPDFEAYLDIARALLAERERCARIVENQCIGFAADDAKLHKIAAAIRSKAQ